MRQNAALTTTNYRADPDHMRLSAGALCLVALATVAVPARQTHAQSAHKTENVVLIVSDGLRWQEIFRGAERPLMSRAPGGVSDTSALLARYWRNDPAERRAALFPFLWGTVAREGQIFGNQDEGSVARIENTFRFSYPGYSEMLTGQFDPRVNSNDFPPNPNVTVFEFLARDPAFRGKVAAIATWDAFHRIFNEQRAGFDVIAGWNTPFTGDLAQSPRGAMLNELYRTSARYWDDNTFDAPMHQVAKEYLAARKPRLLFVGYGETDEWAHRGRYDLLLESAHQMDGFVADLWSTMQSMPQYRDKTTFIITTDHGRGSGDRAWKNHGEKVEGAENIWIAVIGPDTPALGERANVAPVTQSQIAATIASLVGMANPFRSFAPNAALPLPIR
jgi:hypothetical protein